MIQWLNDQNKNKHQLIQANVKYYVKITVFGMFLTCCLVYHWQKQRFFQQTSSWTLACIRIIWRIQEFAFLTCSQIMLYAGLETTLWELLHKIIKLRKMDNFLYSFSIIQLCLEYNVCIVVDINIFVLTGNNAHKKYKRFSIFIATV